jgi:formylglycine-generating enzyme required for sulfatase activity
MAGVRETNWDGFVSSRDDSFVFASYLHDRLREKPTVVRLAYQNTTAELGQSAHSAGSAQLIHTTSFAVVLLSPMGFRASQAGRETQDCFQIRELRRIMERVDDTEAGADAFRVFCVLLQDENGHPTKTEFQEQVLQESRRENAALLAWLDKHNSYHFIRSFQNTASEEFQDDFMELIGQIRSYVREQRDRTQRKSKPAPPERTTALPTTQPDPPPAQREPHAGFAKLESKYLSRAAESWSLGVIGNVSVRGDDDSAFRFKPGRFVEFSANQHSRDGSHEHSRTTHPLSHWLFHTQKLPLMLVGEGGAGKTTALTAAACAFAAQHEARCRTQCLKIADGEWLATASQELSTNDFADYMPVAMRCVDVMAAMGERSDSQALVVAALAHMRRVAELGDVDVSQADGDAFYERLKEQAYIFMLDGLDELANENAAEVLFNAGHTLAIDLSASGFRVVFTTRDCYRTQFSATRVVLDEPLESEKLIETFIARFASDAETEKRLINAAKEMRKRGDAKNVALRTPLLLNAFCCIAAQDGYDVSGRLAEFCERAIDYILRRREFPKLAKVQSDPSRPVEAVARAILRRYALEFVNVSGEGIIRRREDETAAWIRRERAGLGLNEIDVREAKDLLRELASRTSLFRLEKDGTYTFDNATMFWEYLAAEEMTAKGVALHLTDLERLERPAWRSAVRFAHAINVDNQADDRALEAPMALLNAAAAETDPAKAWSVAELALQLLAESPPSDLLGDQFAPPLIEAAKRATEIYSKFKARWVAAVRAKYCDLFFQIGRREEGEKTCLAVDQLLDIFLRERRKWVPVAAEGLPPGFHIADAPVLVSEYRRFESVARTGGEKWWPAADPTAKIDPRLMVSDQSDGSPAAAKRYDSWIRQMDRPGSPVVSVSFHEATAYCLWLTERLQGRPGGIGADEEIRLPTDVEWAALLRWCAKGATYPWGEQSLSEHRERVNWRGADVDHPSPPGVFDAIGEEGLYDLGSNVSVWAVSASEATGWSPVAAKVVPVCGGCWFEFKPDAFETDAKPSFEAPTHRGAGIGFRLVRARKRT